THTAVIPREKNRIASELGEFVRNNFLETNKLIDLVRRTDPAKIVSDWFLDERNSKRFGQQGANLVAWAVAGLNEASIQAVISRTIQQALRNANLSTTLGELLEAMLSQGRHHELLDEVIEKLTGILRDAGARAGMAAKIAETFRKEYPKGQILVPTEALGRVAAEKISVWVERYLQEVSEQPHHALRDAFDKKAFALVVHLRGDRVFARKVDEIKERILTDEKFTGYIGSLWHSLREMLERDLRSSDSEIHKKLVAAGSWIGATLDADEALRSSLNRQVEALVQQFGSSLGEMVSDHIEETVKSWDAVAMSTLIEENIGARLQRIRINGTVIGAVLGAILFTIAHFGSRHA
ncbi:MAG: DUF445 domain-containing protein, partial [Alcaligenaceae bacterium]